jgi:hypothetical protein
MRKAIKRLKNLWKWNEITFHIGISLRYLYVVVLAVSTLSLVIVTLAAYQFQTEIAEVEANSPAGKVSVASELRLLQERYRDFKDYAGDRWAVYLAAEQKVSDELRPGLYATIRKDRRMNWPWLEPLKEVPANDGHAETPMALTGQSAVAGEVVALPSTPSGTDHAAVTSAIEAHLEYLSYEKLIYDQRPDKDESPQLYALYQDMLYFDHLRNITLGLIDPMTLAVMPKWMLTLIVTLALGALGSLLSVTKSFLETRSGEVDHGRRDYLPFSWFVLRPLLGVVTAFAVFVFLQAGLALSDGAFSEGNDNLNPFFIAFIATLSGLMSWQAIASIERWGGRFLGEEAIARWAYGLEGAFKIKPEKTPADLATFLKVDVPQIEHWKAERQRVPQDAQDKIAAWFGIDRRHLFSDQQSA